MARWQEATSWFSPELLTIPLATVRAWMDANPDLAVYRFAIEEVYRQQEHVLDEKGERLMSLSSRLSGAPNEAYQALSTADAKFPEVTLSTGEKVTMSYGQYRAVLATNRNQAIAARRFSRTTAPIHKNLNTYATLYHGVCQRDWFHARARGYETTLDAALHGNAIPRSVVDTLIEATRAGVEPLRRYHRLRRRALKLEQVLPVRFLDSDHRVGSALRLRRGARADRRRRRAARRGLPGADVARLPRALDRRLRERRQAQRRVLRARVRRAPVHAA